ncbi:MAG: peptidase T, partial [Clostridia bacterium]|nr:peptidase T [Clostridia bacterium]
ENVVPVLHENYDGGDVVLGDSGRVLSADTFPHLRSLRGRTLITTDGRTLLGADDKAGIAEIVTLCERLGAGDIPHGKICIGFTPDEEIGEGADFFDVQAFGAEFAYTVDGGALGGIEYENFNAAGAEIVISGRSIHPGDAKDRMVNAAYLACEINARLPREQIPARTSGYEGFFHLTDMNGACEHAEMRYIIRDHDRARFEEKKRVLRETVDAVNAEWRDVYGADACVLSVSDSYYNMKEIFEDKMYIVERAEQAMRACGIEPRRMPIRGGTDGARLSFEGLPCPNLSTGGENYHSRFEYACVEDMEAMVDVLVRILCVQE